MRSRIKKELLACFKREFQPRFPQFRLVITDREFWVWGWKISPNLTYFITLQAVERDYKFNIEVAWSDDGEFPWGAFGEVSVDQPQRREGLGRLWHKGNPEPVWDIAPEVTAAARERVEALKRGESPNWLSPDPPIEQCLLRVEPLVLDALEKLQQYALPLFRRVAEFRGIEWPSEVGSKDL